LKKWIFLGLAVGLILVAVFYWRDEKNLVVSSPATTRSSVNHEPKQIHLLNVPMAREDGGNITVPPGMNKVDFQVREGLAVSFGDVILGTPDDPEVKNGFTLIPAPELWEPPEIPYAISADLPNPQRVQKAIDYLNGLRTAVVFVPYENQADALIFERGKDLCLSGLGKTSGLQPIKLGDSCGWAETLHEIMHSLGFIHEQSRPDRDAYVQINWTNIDEDNWPQFKKVSDGLAVADRGSRFDYQSLMLYPAGLFAKDASQVAMQSKTEVTIAPTRTGLSSGDIARLLQLYPPR
jgi:hypothetical protein